MQGRELLHCLDEVAAMEDAAPIQATTTEQVAKRYDLLRGGMFGSEETVNLDDVFNTSNRLVHESDVILGESNGTVEATEEVAHAVVNLDNPEFTTEDAANFNMVMEAFDVESIKESIYEFYRKVRAFLINLWRKATRLMDIMYRNVQSLKKEAESLIKRCHDIGYAGTVGGIFTAPSVAIVSYKGKVNATSVIEGLLKTSQVYNDAIEVSTKAANAYYPLITDIVNNVARQNSDDLKVAAAFTTVEQLTGHYAYTSEPITGGFIYKGYSNVTQKGFNAGFKVERLEQYYQGIDPAVPLPTVKELQNICANVMKLCDKISWGRARYRTIRTAHNAALDNLDTLVNKIQRGQITHIVKTDAVVSSLTRLITDSITAPIQHLNTIVFRAATGAMLYADRAVKQIEAKA